MLSAQDSKLEWSIFSANLLLYTRTKAVLTHIDNRAGNVPHPYHGASFILCFELARAIEPIAELKWIRKKVTISISPHFVRLLFFYLLRWMSSHQPGRSSEWQRRPTAKRFQIHTRPNTLLTQIHWNTGKHKHRNRLTMRYTCSTTMYSACCFGAAVVAAFDKCNGKTKKRGKQVCSTHIHNHSESNTHSHSGTHTHTRALRSHDLI